MNTLKCDNMLCESNFNGKCEMDDWQVALCDEHYTSFPPKQTIVKKVWKDYNEQV